MMKQRRRGRAQVRPLGKDKLARVTFVHPCKGTAGWFWHDCAARIDTHANTQMFELRDKTNVEFFPFVQKSYF